METFKLQKCLSNVFIKNGLIFICMLETFCALQSLLFSFLIESINSYGKRENNIAKFVFPACVFLSVERKNEKTFQITFRCANKELVFSANSFAISRWLNERAVITEKYFAFVGHNFHQSKLSCEMNAKSSREFAIKLVYVVLFCLVLLRWNHESAGRFFKVFRRMLSTNIYEAHF